MHITCEREILQKYISSADRITSKHSSLPILNTVLLTVLNKNLVVRATNLEVGVEFQIRAQISKEGSIAIPGSLMANALATITDEKEVTLTSSGGICTISTKTKTLTIKGFTPDDFPTIPIIESGDGFIMSSYKFIYGVKSVLMSAAISDIKPEISSVYIYQQQDSIVFVATDSFRLAEKKIKQQGVVIPTGVIIPYKNITEIIRILELEGGDVNFLVTKNQISCATQSIYVTSRVVQGIYPDYEQIIPKSQTTEITLLKDDLVNTLKLSTLFSDKFNKVSIIINPTQKKCTISTKNSDIGETESNLTATLQGDPLEISLNGKHLFDSLSIIDKDSVVIQFNGSDKPAVIRGLGDQSFTYLTMPLIR